MAEDIPELIPVTNRPLPIELKVVHDDEEGIGWADGVTGSP